MRTLKQPNEALEIYAISIDPPDKSKSLAEKIAADGKGNLGFLILSDPGSKTIDAWGLRGQRAHLEAMYLTDRVVIAQRLN